jgi:hypothetical protein
MENPEDNPKRGGSPIWLGVIMAVVGFAGFWLNWQSALEDGHYRPISAAVTPLIGFLGLAFLVVPPQAAEYAAKYGEAALGRRLLRLRAAKLLVLAGFVAAAVNFTLMRGGL